MREEVHGDDSGLRCAGNIDCEEAAQIQVADVPSETLDFLEAEVVANAPEAIERALVERGREGVA